MKKLLILLLVLVPLSLCCITRTVSLDGTHHYTNIQAAINASADGDSILVYPGRYIENINLNSHDVSISSLYSINQQQDFIDNTIIDGNRSTCLSITQGEIVFINGITIVNNEQGSNNFTYTGLGGGGGIRISNSSSVNVDNCIIRDCIADYGGGISASNNAVVQLSNNLIYHNRAYYLGGGLLLSQGNCMIFDALNPSSVYNNVAGTGMDIFIGWMEEYPSPVNIILSLGSIPLTQPDNFFITVFQANATVNIVQGCIPQIDSDVFVSPSGNDSSSGLSEMTSFQTIKHAIQVIRSNPGNPRTIHLASGTYSFSNSGQLWPLNLKPNVRIVGAGAEQTIFDDEFHCSFFAGIHINDVVLSDIGFHHSRASLTNPIDIVESNNIELRNLDFHDNQGYLTSGIKMLRNENCIIENCSIGGTIIDDHIATIFTEECDNLFVNGILSHDNQITDPDYNELGLYFAESDVVLRNSIITNNNAQDAFVLYYQTILPEYADFTLDMSNVLIYNNFIVQCSWAFSPVYLQNRYRPVKVSNCTFAGNLGGGSFTRLFAYADVSNLISYNPQFSNEMYLRNRVWNSQTGQYVEAEVNIKNSLFHTGSIDSDLPNLVNFTDNIMNGNPLFLGSTTDSLEVTQPEYYYLSENSPCINMGVADTTGMNLPPMDLAGNQRVWNNRIDMGCYEYDSEPYVSIDNPENPPLPDRIALSTYPNPVYLSGSRGAYTFIEFTLPAQPKEQPVIEIYNIKGQKIKTIKLTQSYNGLIRKAGLSKQVKQGGEFYSTVWNCRNEQNQAIGSGLYIIKVTSGSQQAITKMMVIK